MVALFPSPKSTPALTKSYGTVPHAIEIPSLIQVQVDSFEWFKTEGLHELFAEISPIEDFTGGRFELHFLDHAFHEPKYTETECRERETTYEAPLYVTTRLVVKDTGEIKESPVFLGNIPLMTRNGTFIINGAERVVVSQLVRSPGVYFTIEDDPATGRPLCFAKFVPYRGAWLEFETSARDMVSVKVDRKRKIPVTTLLRAIGLESDEALLKEFEAVDTNPDHQYIHATMVKDSSVHNKDEALIEFYKHLRPGEPPSLDNAKALLTNLFFNPRRYDLGRVGRYKLNRRMELGNITDERTLTKNDIIGVVRTMVRINNGAHTADDIDHLGNRRVRAVGELIQNQLRVGLLRMERTVKEKMSISEIENVTPAALVNQRPVAAAVREFFGGSQLSQFMDQTNPLA
ncbi:MAG: DNA-directed RNA polymerase subunit beta, partial [Chloroflexi bacterium]|nr:DNA-directed RNA polymerase subunit beta [Chloroflexota bacterium]